MQRAAIQSGMHCVGCPSSIGESLEQACAVHGLDVDEVLQSINEYLSAKKRLYDYQNVSLATGGRGYVLVFFLGYGKLLWVGRILRFLADWGARVTLIYMHHGRKPVKNK